MVAPSVPYTPITDSQIDSGSPITVALETAYRDNDTHLQERIGDLTFQQDANHDHDGINSALLKAGWVPLAEVTIADNDQYGQFTALDLTYDAHVVQLIGCRPKNNQVHFYSQVSVAAVFDTANNYSYGSSTLDNNWRHTAVSTSVEKQGNAANEFLFGEIYLYGANKLAHTNGLGHTGLTGDNGVMSHNEIACRYKQNLQVDGWRFFWESGNWTEGTLKLFGIA